MDRGLPPWSSPVSTQKHKLTAILNCDRLVQLSKSTKRPSFFVESTFRDFVLQVAYEDKALILTLVVINIRSTSGFQISKSLLSHIIQILTKGLDSRFN